MFSGKLHRHRDARLSELRDAVTMCSSINIKYVLVINHFT